MLRPRRRGEVGIFNISSTIGLVLNFLSAISNHTPLFLEAFGTTTASLGGIKIKIKTPVFLPRS